MPKVPTYDNFTVGQDNLQGPAAQPNTTPDTVLGGARQQQALGDALQRTGDAVFDAGYHMQRQAEEMRVANGLNDLWRKKQELEFGTPDDPTSGFRNQKGDVALNRETGLPLPEEYRGKLQAYADSVANEIGGERAKSMFSAKAGHILNTFTQDAQKHYVEQYNDVNKSVRVGTMGLMQQEASLNWGDPDKIYKAISSGEAALVDKGRIEGKSSTEIEFDALKYRSSIHSDVVMSALKNGNLQYANDYFNAQRKKGNAITGDDVLKIEGIMGPQADAALAIAAANKSAAKFNNQIPGSQGYDFNAALSVLTNTESGNRQFKAPGVPLVSDKGAYGVSQLLLDKDGKPGTARMVAEKHGIPYEEERVKHDEGYNRMLGALEFNDKIQEFGGLAQAYAAYNAGPGKKTATGYAADGSQLPGVWPAIARADKTGGNWLDEVPRETREYVQKNMAAYEARATTSTKAQQVPTYAALEQDIVANLGGNPTPRQLELARTQAAYQHKVMTDTYSQNKEQTLTSAYSWLANNNFAFNSMPADLKQQVIKYAPDKMSDVQSFAKNGLEGVRATNPVVYMQLTSNPAKLRDMSDSDFLRASISGLSEPDMKTVLAQRNALQGKKNVEKMGELNMPAISAALAPWYKTMGITDDKPTQDDLHRMGVIQKVVYDSITREQSVKGKQLGDTEVLNHVNAMFARTSTKDASMFGLMPSLQSTRMLSMKIGDVPRAERNAIKDAFTKQGITDPSDSDILEQYFKRQSSTGTR